EALLRGDRGRLHGLVVLEQEEGRAHEDQVARLQAALPDRQAVDERALEAVEVTEPEPVLPPFDDAMPARDRGVAQLDAVRGVAADLHEPLQGERGPGRGTGDGGESPAQSCLLSIRSVRV